MARKRLTPLARQRRAAGLTQTKLAGLMDVDTSTISRWESGKVRPAPDEVPKLAQFIHVPAIRVEELIEAGELLGG